MAAQTINLAWDPSPDTSVVGYTVHVGPSSGSYTQTFDVAGRLSTGFSFTQATPGVRYYFAVSAYNAENEHSAYSNEVSWKINVGPSLAQPSNQTGAVGGATSLQLSATDDGDPLQFSATGLPNGLSVNQSSGLISGTPTAAGTFNVNATVSDGPLSASRSFTWTIGPALSVTSFGAAPASPQQSGTQITLTAAATGGVAAYQYKFLATLSGSTTVLRTWGASNTHTWTPTGAGSYTITVWARSAGNNVDAAEALRTLSFTVVPGPLSVDTLTANRTSPQLINTAINLSATASSGTAPYQYKFLATVGGTTTVLRNWASSASYTWVPNAGASYVLTVWARSSGNTADAAEASRTLNFTIVAPFTLSGLTSNLASPQRTGTAVTFTAASSGGQAPHQYKWWQYDGANWSLLRDWSTNGSFTWTPTQANASYRIAIWARSAEVTADSSAYNTWVPYVITVPPPNPLSITSLTSNVASPQVAGTTVTFTAAVSGGVAPIQYKWWQFDGNIWSEASGWSTSSTFTWRPMQANPNYRFGVWVRNPSTPVDAFDANTWVAYPITTSGSSSPLTITSLTSNVASPRTTGTSITFTAAASGGTAPYQYKWWQYNGSTWTMLRDWNGSNSYVWTPTQANPDYQIGVWVRNASTTADVADANTTVPYVITASGSSSPLSISSFTSSVASPQTAGTAITFTTVATGGTGPYQYKWWQYDGTSWTEASGWSAANTFTWRPMQANSNYRFGVWVRNSTTTSDTSDANTWVSYPITAPGTSAPLTVTSLTSNLASPRTSGTAITFTAAASGGMAPYQYKWWQYNGSMWTMLRDWSGSNSYTWTPTQANPNYQIGVWVRNVTTTADVNDAMLAVPYVITAPGTSAPLTISSLTSNVASPQVIGTAITFTAAATGGTGPYQYKWWLNDGAWTEVSGWSGSPSFTWTPSVADPNYRIGVWVRNATTTGDVADANTNVSFAITPPAPSGTLTITSLTSNLASPRATGTPITFTVAATGGAAPYQVKWWLFNGATWTVLQDWNGSNTYTWTPNMANPNYRVGAWVRNNGSSEDEPDANQSVAYPITSANPTAPISLVALTTNLSSPQRVGTQVTFTLVAGGASGSYQSKWWLFNGSTWTLLRDWSSASTLNWTPSSPNVNYRIGVWVRDASSTVDSSSFNTNVAFPIVP